MSGFPCRCDRSRICCPNVASTSATRRYGSGGTGSVRCLQRRSGSVGFYLHSHSNWRWHLDEVFVRINGQTHHPWRAVDHAGEVLEVFATKRRDRRAALTFLKRAMKRYGRPASIVTDRLRSYRAAMNVIGCGRPDLRSLAQQPGGKFTPAVQTTGRGNGEIPGRQDRVAAVHASIDNHFNHNRHLSRRDTSFNTPLRRVGRVASTGSLTQSASRTSLAGSH